MQHKFSQNLIAGFNDGSNRAMQRMFESYFPVIERKIAAIIGRTPELEDLKSEVIARVLTCKREYKTIKGFESYLNRVVVGTCKDYIKRMRVRQNHADKLKYHLLQTEDDSTEKDQMERTCQLLTYLAIETLPRKKKQVFLLFYSNNMTNKQIAERMGITESTVENHKNIAFKMIRSAYDRHSGKGYNLFIASWIIPLILAYLLIQKLL